MSKTRLICLTAFMGLLAACQPTTLPIVDQPTAQILRLDITPETTWILPSLDTCARDSGGILLTVREIATYDLDVASTDILILSGSPNLGNSSVVELGQTSAAVIVHPDNPLDKISIEALAEMFSGQLLLWSQVDPALPAEEIQVWLPLPQGETWQAVKQNLLTDKNSKRSAHIAPDPQAMLSAVAADTSAVGILPAAYLDQTVKEMETPLRVNLPIVAVTPDEPVGLARDFLLCIQDAIQENGPRP